MTTIIASAVTGSLLTILVHLMLKKRGRFGYTVTHNRVGLSADDVIFGSVKVIWEGSELSNLYASTVTLTNHSLNDYENVVVKAFTNDSYLLNESTEIVGTTKILE